MRIPIHWDLKFWFENADSGAKDILFGDKNWVGLKGKLLLNIICWRFLGWKLNGPEDGLLIGKEVIWWFIVVDGWVGFIGELFWDCGSFKLVWMVFWFLFLLKKRTFSSSVENARDSILSRFFVHYKLSDRVNRGFIFLGFYGK